MKIKERYFITRIAGAAQFLGVIKCIDMVGSKNYKRGYDIGHGVGYSNGHRAGYDLGASEANVSIKDIFNRED